MADTITYNLAISCGLVAQSVEQRIENPCVGGSIPPRATKKDQIATLRVGYFHLVWRMRFKLLIRIIKPIKIDFMKLTKASL